jgi:PAS domain S-box-containing protein
MQNKDSLAEKIQPDLRATPVPSQDGYETLVRSIDGIFWEADAATLLFTFVSNQAKRILGYPIEEWLKPDFWADHLHPEDHEWTLASCINAIKKVQDHQSVYRMIAADGRIVWLRSSVSVDNTDPDHIKLRGVMLDVTESRHEQERMLKEKRLTDEMLESMPGAFYMFNERGERLRWNSVFEQVTGYHGDEVLNLPFLHTIAREQKGIVAKTVAEVFAGGTGSVEADIVAKDGKRTPYVLSGRHVKIGSEQFLIGLAIDITARRQAEEKLRLSEERFSKAFNASPEPITIFRHRDGMLLEVNDRWTQVYGFTREEAVGSIALKPAQMTGDDCIKLQKAVEKDKSLREYQIEIKTKKGETRYISLSAEQIIVDGELCNIFLHRDITEERYAWEVNRRLILDLGERVKELTALHETARILQDESRSVSEILRDIVQVLPAAWKYPSITAACIRFGTLEFKTTKFQPTQWSQSAEFHAAGNSGTIEIVYLEQRPDADTGPFLKEERNLLDSLAEMIKSALDRRYSQEALQTSEGRYRDLVENALDIIYTHDMNGRITSLNSAGEKITGYSLQEAMSMHLTDAVAPEFLERAHQITADALAGKENMVNDLEIIAKDGRRISIEISNSVILHDGVPIGVQGIARDVTERRQLEDQLRQSQRLESIGQLAGGIAHDFNNILTAINGYSELTLRKLDADSPLRINIEEIKKASERSTKLINQLLAFSRKQIMQPSLLELDQVVADIEKMLRPIIPNNVVLQTEASPDLGLVRADPVQMEQVLMNLVVNARDAMPGGGTISVKLDNVYLDKEFGERRVLANKGLYVLLEVKDTGTGMDEATLQRIFEPFFTTKDRGKGTGLGLATVYGIVKQSGGYIWADSELGHGSTFHVYLPLVEEDSPNPTSDGTEPH